MSMRLFRQLLRKELHLQRSNLLFLYGVVAFWVLLRIAAVRGSVTILNYQLSEILSAIHTLGVLSSLVIILPLMFGAAAIAGERQIGVLDWQLALPVSRTRQLGVKVFVVVFLAVISGGFLAFILDYFLPPARTILQQYRGVWTGFYSPLLACIGLLASALMRDAYRALLLSGGLLLALLIALRIPDINGIVWPHQVGAYGERIHHPLHAMLRILLLAIPPILLARYWFRPAADRPRRFAFELPLWLILCIAVTNWGVYTEHAVPLLGSGPDQHTLLGSVAVNISIYNPAEAPPVTSRFELSHGHYIETATQIHQFRTLGHSWSEEMSHEVALQGNRLLEVEQRDQALYSWPALVLDEHAWRSPAGRFAVQVYDYNHTPTLLDIEVPTGHVRQFPGGLGELEGWSGKHGYVLRTNGAWTAVGDSIFPRHVNADCLPQPLFSGPNPQRSENDAILSPAYNASGQFSGILWKGGQRYTVTASHTSAVSWLGRSQLMLCYVPAKSNDAVTSSSRRNRDSFICLLKVDPLTSTARLIETNELSRSDDYIAADHSSRWYVRGEYGNGLYHTRATICQLGTDGNKTGKEYTLFDASKLQPVTISSTGLLRQLEKGNVTSVTLCQLPGRADSPERRELQTWSIGSGQQADLQISPDGRYLGYTLVTFGAISMAGETQRIIPIWNEMHAFDLTDGSDHLLGGFLPSELASQYNWSGPAPSIMDSPWNQDSRKKPIPTLAWSPDNRLYVLDSGFLYAFDPAAAKAATLLAAPFQKFNVSQCEARDLTFWDNSTLVLWGSKSIWKLHFLPQHKPTRSQTIAAAH